jgi:hypothetical protein
MQHLSKSITLPQWKLLVQNPKLIHYVPNKQQEFTILKPEHSNTWHWPWSWSNTSCIIASTWRKWKVTGPLRQKWTCLGENKLQMLQYKLPCSCYRIPQSWPLLQNLVNPQTYKTVHGEEASAFPDVGLTKQEVKYGGFWGKLWTMLIDQTETWLYIRSQRQLCNGCEL